MRLLIAVRSNTIPNVRWVCLPREVDSITLFSKTMTTTMNLTKQDFIEHAHKMIAETPDITDRELQADLELFYLSSLPQNELKKLKGAQAVGLGAGVAVGGLFGAVCTENLLSGSAKILKGTAKMIATGTIDGRSVAEVIEGAIEIARGLQKE